MYTYQLVNHRFIVKCDGRAVGFITEADDRFIAHVYGCHPFPTLTLRQALQGVVAFHQQIFGSSS